MPLIPILLSLVAKVAPGIIGSLFGSKAEDIAGRVVGVAQAVTGTSSQEEAAAALNADPAKLLELQEKLAQLTIEAAQAEYADRANARAREVAIPHDPTVRNLAYITTVGFFSFLGMLVFHGMPESPSLPILLGSLTTAWLGIMAYYFGGMAPSQRGAAKSPLDR